MRQGEKKEVREGKEEVQRKTRAKNEKKVVGEKEAKVRKTGRAREESEEGHHESKDTTRVRGNGTEAVRKGREN